MTSRWMVTSHQTRLFVEGREYLASGWPDLLPQIPNATVVPVDSTFQAAGEICRLAIDDAITLGDLRRTINARLHAAHLRHDVLSLHGVALTRHGRGVLFLGGHGSGKSLSGLAMATNAGWSAVAGDTCLVRVRPGDPPAIVGGTTAYLVDGSAMTRWFPDVTLPAEASGRVDLTAPRAGEGAGCLTIAAPRDAALTTVAWVHVDSGTQTASWGRFDGQTAASAVYRASGYLLGKVLDHPVAQPLSLMEDADLAARRLGLARHLARALGCWWIRGDPHQIGDVVNQLAREGAAR